MIWLAAVGLALLVAAAHPFVTYPLSLKLVRPRPREVRRSGGVRRSVAICMCAYNEAAVIVAKVEQLIDLAVRHGRAPGVHLGRRRRGRHRAPA